MGYIDQTWFRFSCAQCKTTEVLTVIQNGSAYGASWNDAPMSKSFKITWEDAPDGEPRPISATCNDCKTPAKIEVSSSRLS